MKVKKRHPRSFQDFMTEAEIILLRNFGETLDDVEHSEIMRAWNNGLSVEKFVMDIEQKNHLERNYD